MLIDLLFLVTMVIAVFKGLSRGLIVGVFSIVGLVVGLAAAMKLSAVVAIHLSNSTNISAKWLPVLSFILVFIVAVIIVNLLARIIQKAAESLFLGLFNRIGGAVLYVLLYSIIFSVVLFYIVQIHLVSSQTIADSRVYSIIQPLGPYVVNSIGKVAPVFKDLFRQLEEFFSEVSTKVALL